MNISHVTIIDKLMYDSYVILISWNISVSFDVLHKCVFTCILFTSRCDMLMLTRNIIMLLGTIKCCSQHGYVTCLCHIHKSYVTITIKPRWWRNGLELGPASGKLCDFESQLRQKQVVTAPLLNSRQ